MNKVLVTVMGIITFAGMILSPETCINSALKGMNLCATAIIPSLFPFFICVKIFTNSGLSAKLGKCMSKIMRPLFNLPGESAFVLLMGMLSGYPVGAKCAVSMYENNRCTKDEAERLICFCNNSGPMFVIGTVGTVMLLDKQAGIVLYLSNVLSALTIGIFLGLKRKPEIYRPQKNTVDENKSILADAVSESVNLIFYVCGFIIFFNIFVSLIELTNLLPKGVLYCLFEITNGISYISATAIGNYKLPLISFVLGWSGISIIVQVLGITDKYGFSKIKFIVSKLTQGCLSFVYTVMLLNVPSIPQFINILVIGIIITSILLSKLIKDL